MKVKAKLNYLRIAPRKVRLVADLIRGRKVDAAKARLAFANKKGAEPVSKLLDSAIANASHNFELKKDNLYISEIKVDEGPTLKRWMPRARGAAYQIQKKTSHISLTLSEIDQQEVKTGKKGKITKIKQSEKPKEADIKSEAKTAKAVKDDKPKKDQKGKGKNIFRRKSI